MSTNVTQPTGPPELSVMVLAYNHPELLPDCVASIDAQDIPVPHEKVLVDNGSMPRLPVPPGWRGVYLTPNVGNVGGQNACFQEALGAYVLFVSNDVRFTWNTEAIAEMWAHRGDWQTMPEILWPNLEIQSLGGQLLWPGYGVNRRTEGPLDYVPSIAYLMPKALWQSIGGFDEHYHGAYEDVDLGHRLGRSRLRRGCCESQVVHVGNATLCYTTNRPFHRGRQLFIRKHYRGWDRATRLAAEWVLYQATRLKKALTY